MTFEDTSSPGKNGGSTKLNDANLKGGKKVRNRVGRTDKSGQEAIIKLTVLRERVPKLKKLLLEQEEAAEAYSAAVKAAAEASGLLAKVVKRFVKAKAGDNYDDQQKEVTQLALVFETNTPFLKG